MYKVVLWGGGNGYNKFIHLQGHKMVEVVAVVDREQTWSSYFDGIPVIRPEELNRYYFDYLIISVIDDHIFNNIVVDAQNIGIKRESILPLRIFTIPFFDFEDYIRIKESNISILSDFCFAGILYHRFGMKFTSPTINMFADNDNYLRFLRNIEKYMRKPMKRVEDVLNNPYKEFYFWPRGRVGDVEFNFNHDVIYETAAERWQRGVERFNFDNYIVIMTLFSDQAAVEFDALPIEHKIGFYWKDLSLENVVYLPEWNDPNVRKKMDYNFVNMVNSTASDGRGVHVIDWMRALLHKKNYYRYSACIY